ncbi:hypothetical protein PHYBOEH_005828 [Phytophthora boehmeriae]|uniref:Uncharacterized protein n=1 Tax=Phytophthora boehmeriae TaxID=109152 RepID=A0A8T1X8R2_9STRA|nr:hypothetical protein PHYBOEH_005828 [Phytophthora boehmeriae]
MPPPAPTEVSTAAPDSSIYDKQLAWKLHGQRKLASKSQELRAQQEQQCTFAPKTNSKLQRSLDDSGLDEEEDGEEKVTTAETEAALLHPTESQESSIQLHLARQGRAREHAREAQHKLNGAQQAKDFTKVTTFEPFTLSTTNWKPRQSTTESPTKVDNNQQQSKSTSKGSGNPKTKAQPAASRKSNKSPHSPPCATKEETWESNENWHSGSKLNKKPSGLQNDLLRRPKRSKNGS